MIGTRQWGIILLMIVLASGISCEMYGQAIGSKTDDDAIRKSTYQYALARLKGDTEGFKRSASGRSLRFYDIIYEVLCDIPNIKEQFEKNGIVDGETYLRDAFDAIARANVRYSRSDQDFVKQALATSKGPIEYSHSNEAFIIIKVQVTTRNLDGTRSISEIDKKWRAVLEGGKWKIDDTNQQKEIYLQYPLSPANRERLIKY